VETIDRETLELCKQCGVYIISLGIESGSDRILESVRKHLNVEMIRKKCELIRQVGIDMAGFFILGFPSERREEIQKTIRLSLELPLIRANFFDFLPLPGTDIYYDLKSRGQLNAVDWDGFNFMSAPYVPQGMTRRELRNLQRMAFIRFYFLRPRILLRNIRKIKSLRHFSYLFRRFYHWLIM
jgi:radical SAM superfamily enzyme YgiQ (UPF0313 family)